MYDRSLIPLVCVPSVWIRRPPYEPVNVSRAVPRVIPVTSPRKIQGVRFPGQRKLILRGIKIRNIHLNLENSRVHAGGTGHLGAGVSSRLLRADVAIKIRAEMINHERFGVRRGRAGVCALQVKNIKVFSTHVPSLL